MFNVSTRHFRFPTTHCFRSDFKTFRDINVSRYPVTPLGLTSKKSCFYSIYESCSFFLFHTSAVTCQSIMWIYQHYCFPIFLEIMSLFFDHKRPNIQYQTFAFYRFYCILVRCETLTENWQFTILMTFPQMDNKFLETLQNLY